MPRMIIGRVRKLNDSNCSVINGPPRLAQATKTGTVRKITKLPGSTHQ